jgi:hypothetical protein
MNGHGGIAQFVSFRGRWFAEAYHGREPDRYLFVVAGKRTSDIVGIELNLYNGSRPMCRKATMATRDAVMDEMLASEEFAQMRAHQFPGLLRAAR